MTVTLAQLLGGDAIALDADVEYAVRENVIEVYYEGNDTAVHTYSVQGTTVRLMPKPPQMDVQMVKYMDFGARLSVTADTVAKVPAIVYGLVFAREYIDPFHSATQAEYQPIQYNPDFFRKNFPTDSDPDPFISQQFKHIHHTIIRDSQDLDRKENVIFIISKNDREDLLNDLEEHTKIMTIHVFDKYCRIENNNQKFQKKVVFLPETPTGTDGTSTMRIDVYRRKLSEKIYSLLVDAGICNPGMLAIDRKHRQQIRDIAVNVTLTILDNPQSSQTGKYPTTFIGKNESGDYTIINANSLTESDPNPIMYAYISEKTNANIINDIIHWVDDIIGKNSDDGYSIPLKDFLNDTTKDTIEINNYLFSRKRDQEAWNIPDGKTPFLQITNTNSTYVTVPIVEVFLVHEKISDNAIIVVFT